MLKITLLEMLLRTIPEGIIIAFAICVFSNEIINRKKIIISGLIFGICIYFIRLLPISFGVHSILLIMIYILISTYYNNIKILKTISSSILSIIILSFFELVNFYMLVDIFNIPINVFLTSPIKKTIAGYPSLLLFFIVIFLSYKFKYKDSKGMKING